MWDFIVWNTSVAAVLALVVKGLSFTGWMRRRPAVLHLCWLLVLLKLITPSFVALPIQTETKTANLFRSLDEQTVASRTAQITALEEVAVYVRPTAHAESEAAVLSKSLEPSADAPSAETPLAAMAPAGEVTSFSSLMGSGVSRSEGAGYGVVLWPLVSCGLLAIFWRQHRRMEVLVQSVRRDDSLSTLVERVARQLGCRGIPRAGLVDANTSPALIGWFQPMIVVPSWAMEQIPRNQLQAIVAHELAHYQRYDHLVAFATSVFQACMWWNPVAWWSVRELRHAQELCCDAVVVSQASIAPATYAESLWKVALALQVRRPATQPTLAIVPSRSGACFRERMSQLLVSGRLAHATRSGWVGLLLLAVLAACYPTIGATLRDPDAFTYQVSSDLRPSFCETLPNWPGGSVDDARHDMPAGSIQSRGHFWFGTTDNPVLLAVTGGSQDAPKSLYIDSNRDEHLSHDEVAQRIDSQTWRARIQLQPTEEAATGGPVSDDSVLLVRYRDQRLEVAQAGQLQGVVSLGDELVAVNVEDRNCNGVWTDREDRLHIDWNGDGRFSPLRERFSCQASPTIDGTRYALAFRDDLLRLKRLEGTGRITAQISLADEKAVVEECRAVLASTDGVHVTLSSLDQPIEVPVGRYAVKQLRLRLRGERVWGASFEQSGGANRTMAVVEKDGEVLFDLLGHLKLSAQIAAGGIESPVDGQLVVQPTLNTESGLYLSSSTVGTLEPQDDNPLTASLMRLGMAEKRMSAVETTGFGCGAFCPITFSGEQVAAGSALVVLRFDSGPLAGVLTRTIGSAGAKSD